MHVRRLALLALIPSLGAGPAALAQEDGPVWEFYSPYDGRVQAAIHYGDVTLVTDYDLYHRADTADAWTGPYDTPQCGGCKANSYAVGPDASGSARLYVGRLGGGPVYRLTQWAYGPEPYGYETLIEEGGDAVAPLRPDLLVVGGRNGFEDSFPTTPGADQFDIAVSRDGGQTWRGSTANPPDVDGFGYGEAFAVLGPESQAPDRLLAGVVNGLAYSVDYGRTWRRPADWFVPFRYTAEVMAYDAEGGPAGSGAEAGTAYAGVRDDAEGGFRLVATRDGAVWEERAWITPATVGSPQALLALPGGRLVLATDDTPGNVPEGRMLTSTDGGRTWTPYGEGYPTGPGTAARDGGLARGTDGRLYAATYGRGAWRTAEPVAPQIPVASEPPPVPVEGEGLGEVRPNPSSGGVSVPLALARAARVEVEVLDLLGRRVGVLYRGPLAAGRHEFAFDGAAVPPGLYVVRAQVGDRVLPVRRFTVVR